MKVCVPVSIGELFDKISILEIKKNRIKDKDKLIIVQKEYDELTQVACGGCFSPDDCLYEELKGINTDLWIIEDRIRRREKRKQFDQTFIDLARKIYILNDTRSAIKRKINQLHDSEYIEVKQYAEYEVAT